MNGKVAIISGGVSDIGKTIAELFAGKGARLDLGPAASVRPDCASLRLGRRHFIPLHRFALPEEDGHHAFSRQRSVDDYRRPPDHETRLYDSLIAKSSATRQTTFALVRVGEIK
jgi:NAD(P)-dependent dehydrogenase (short-subunit alcohol dehydrogenase family)